MRHLLVPSFVLFVSTAVFVATWFLAPGDSRGDLAWQAALPEPRPASISPSEQVKPQTEPAVLTNAPRTVYGYDQPFKIALTFDDGPHPLHTPRVLNVLKKFDVTATFFVNGYWLAPSRGDAKHARAALVRAHQDGHTIANHTFSHARLSSLPPEQQRWQILANEMLLTSLTGQKPRLFRPPYGKLTPYASDILNESGYSVMRWNVASADENGGYPPTIAATVMQWIRRHHGGIVLLHDRFRCTAEATRLVLSRLAEENCTRLARGEPTYEIVPLDSFLRSPAELRARGAALADTRQQHLARLSRVCRRSLQKRISARNGE